MSQPNKVSHKLKDVVRRELALELDKDHQKADWGGRLTDEMLAYAAADAKVLLPLAEALTLKAKEAKLELAADIEGRAFPAVAWMANAGLPFDRKGWTEHLKELEQEKRLLTKELDELAPERPDGKSRNWNSHLQVKEAFELAGLKIPNIQGGERPRPAPSPAGAASAWRGSPSGSTHPCRVRVPTASSFPSPSCGSGAESAPVRCPWPPSTTRSWSSATSATRRRPRRG